MQEHCCGIDVELCKSLRNSWGAMNKLGYSFDGNGHNQVWQIHTLLLFCVCVNGEEARSKLGLLTYPISSPQMKHFPDLQDSLPLRPLSTSLSHSSGNGGSSTVVHGSSSGGLHHGVLSHHPLIGPFRECLMTNPCDPHQAVREKGNPFQSTSTGSDYFLNEICYCPLL